MIKNKSVEVEKITNGYFVQMTWTVDDNYQSSKAVFVDWDGVVNFLEDNVK